MTSVPVPDQVNGRVQPDQYMRNELLVTPYTTNALVTAANQLLLQRGKELFSSSGPVGTTGTIPTSVNTRARFHFAAHTSPNLYALEFRALVARPDSSGAAAARLQLYDSAGTTLLIGIDLPYSGSAGDDSPDELVELAGIVGVAADTEIVGVISDVTKGRIAQAAVWEMMRAPDTENGYLAANAGNGTPILEADRSAIAAIANPAWKHGAAAIAHVNAAGTLVGTATDTNIIDNTSTSVSAATPGITLDMRYKNRLSKTTVPVRMRVLALSTDGGGHVVVKDSTGTAVITASSPSTSLAWITVDGALPATLAKYDIMVAASGATAAHATAKPTSSGLTLTWPVAGTIGNSSHLVVVINPGSGTASIAVTESGTTITITITCSSDHLGSLESDIATAVNGSGYATAATTTPTNRWNLSGAQADTYSFSGGVDAGGVTVSAVSLYELDP